MQFFSGFAPLALPVIWGDDPVLTGKIAWAHSKEIRDYYTRLDQRESEAEEQDKNPVVY